MNNHVNMLMTISWCGLSRRWRGEAFSLVFIKKGWGAGPCEGQGQQTQHSAVQHPGTSWAREILESQLWNSDCILVCLGMGPGVTQDMGLVTQRIKRSSQVGITKGTQCHTNLTIRWQGHNCRAVDQVWKKDGNSPGLAQITDAKPCTRDGIIPCTSRGWEAALQKRARCPGQKKKAKHSFYDEGNKTLK